MRSILQIAALGAVFALSLFGQRGRGELRVHVQDPTGAPLRAEIELTGLATGVATRQAASNGAANFQPVPFGNYQLRVTARDFAAHSELVEIRSAVPVEIVVKLSLTPLETAVQVREWETLLDPQQPGMAQVIGQKELDTRHSITRSRAALETVNEQPGWLLEANGVLHPRGSEYSTQYVIDGVPLTDNRSPGFAPALELEDLESMRIMTGNYPAEYGRKLGGVVEVQTGRPASEGTHGRFVADGGSFGSLAGYAGVQSRWGRNTASLAGYASKTDRFLDPPAVENYTNKASTTGASGRWERDTNERNRFWVYGHSKRSLFLVPNEELQQEAGQRQDRRTVETLGQFAYTRILGPTLLAQVSGMGRDLAGDLWSNLQSTPIRVRHERGFRDGYGAASLSWQRGRHSAKFGGEFAWTSLQERLAYSITEDDYFDDDLPKSFLFSDTGKARETGLYAQDLIRAGRWTFNLGLRFDRYSLMVNETAWSPRLGVAYHVPEAGLILRASYDRAFETPAAEGILIASSGILGGISDEAAQLPLRPTRSHFWQAGFAKSLWRAFRLEGVYYQRHSRNFGDDALLLNTGVSFPLTFDRAKVHGVEAKLELPRWRGFSGFASYSNMTATGQLPLTGGLFLEDDSEHLLQSNATFPITQDQRNTVRGMVRHQFHPNLWVSTGLTYNSGLPFEQEGPGFEEGDDIEERYSEEILEQVDLERGRVKPSFSWNAGLGWTLRRTESDSVEFQFDAFNLTNRLNLINFAGLFSGTAIAVPRSFAARLVWKF
jgi:hypothetical protein